MIYFNIPWAEDRDIANAYNQFMEIIPNDTDFACFIDADAMFLHEFFGSMLYEVIEKHPNKNFFCSYVSRCAYDGSGVWAIPTKEECNPLGVSRDEITQSNDIEFHKKVAKLLWQKNKTDLIEVNQSFLNSRKTSSGDLSYFSGTCFLIRKSLWRKINKFKSILTDGFSRKLIGVDNRLHKDVLEAEESLYLMKGIYSYHWYRNSKNKEEFYDYCSRMHLIPEHLQDS